MFRGAAKALNTWFRFPYVVPFKPDDFLNTLFISKILWDNLKNSFSPTLPFFKKNSSADELLYMELSKYSLEKMGETVSKQQIN